MPKDPIKYVARDGNQGGTGRAARIAIPVRILDRRTAYGRKESLYAPVGGGGQCWIADESIHDTIEAALKND